MSSVAENRRVSADEQEAPVWVRGAAAVIRRLPAGRFRAAAFVARARPRPFVARMPEAAGGSRFWCDLADEIARDVCLTGEYEPQETRLLSLLLQPGMTVVDAGANWGYFTLLAAHLVGSRGRVVALEPDPRMWALLEWNTRLNRLGQVEALPIAAGRERGTLTLEGHDSASGNRGVSRIVADADPHSATTFTVASARLDDLLTERGVGDVDLVKIDVEGAEDAVLDGMRAGLAAGRYRRVLIELHPGLLAARGVGMDACCGALAAAGYLGWAFDHSARGSRRASYTRAMPLADLLHRTDTAPASDPWPHMLWTLPAFAPMAGPAGAGAPRGQGSMEA